MIDKEQLLEAINRSGKTKVHLAKRLDITTQSLYNKLNGVTQFSRLEIEELYKELGLPEERKE